MTPTPTVPKPLLDDCTQIKECCLYVRDLDRTRTFYQSTLGLPLLSHKAGRHVFFHAGQTMLLCFLAEATSQDTDLPPHGASGVQHFAFEVPADQYTTTLMRFQTVGIPIIHRETWQPGVESFYFHDPDGHCLEVIPSGMWPRNPNLLV